MAPCTVATTSSCGVRMKWTSERLATTSVLVDEPGTGAGGAWWSAAG